MRRQRCPLGAPIGACLYRAWFAQHARQLNNGGQQHAIQRLKRQAGWWVELHTQS